MTLHLGDHVLLEGVVSEIQEDPNVHGSIIVMVAVGRSGVPTQVVLFPQDFADGTARPVKVE